MKKLNEVSRKNIIGKTKVQSPDRYNKRLRYSVMSVPEIDEDKFIYNDRLVIYVSVGKYTVTLAYEGVMRKLIDLVSRDALKRVTRRYVVRALNEQVDQTDVYINCTCCDMRYRYRYFATKYDYLEGEPETRPSDITNPHDDIGAACKHVMCVLANKKWLVKAASVVNEIIHERYDDILKQYDLTPEEFSIDEEHYTAAAIGAANREHRYLPAELVGVQNRLYSPEELDQELFDLLNHRGYKVRVDTDLDTPVAVYISKNEEALEDVDNNTDVYEFEIKPAGSNIRLQWVRK